MLGFDPEDDDDEIMEYWKANIKIACKPCLELKYCPYGPLVEKFPIYPILRKEAIETMYDPRDDDFDPDDYPLALPPKIILDCFCEIFGHMCPVFFMKEPFTESSDQRRISRHIPLSVKLKVIRKDKSQCQICGKLLKDEEVQFDHIIPYSKGGPSDIHNLQVVCAQCNRKKSNIYFKK